MWSQEELYNYRMVWKLCVINNTTISFIVECKLIAILHAVIYLA